MRSSETVGGFGHCDSARFDVYTCTVMHSTRSRSAPSRPRPRRSGKPLIVYFDDEQAERLRRVANGRHVSKATVVRVAVAQLLRQLDSGQLVLPIGLEDGR